MSTDRPTTLADALSEFDIRGVLGEGGSGTVYDARDGDQRVALKVLRDDQESTSRDRLRFVGEARRMARVSHPGLVKLVRAGTLSDGRPFLVMPFVEGTTLASRLANGPLTVEQAVHAFVVLARAVAALHGAGIVHRDIKPENILLVECGGLLEPVLLDLGIARETESAPSTTTVSGRIRGTPAYMAPERFFGVPASERSDVYELGVTLYVMLVGKLPWGSVSGVTERLSPRSPGDFDATIPATLARVILRALSTRSEVRPESASAFADEVERAWREGGATELLDRPTELLTPCAYVEPAPAGSATPPPRRARRAVWLGLAISFAGAGALYALVRAPSDSGVAAASVEAAPGPVAIAAAPSAPDDQTSLAQVLPGAAAVPSPAPPEARPAKAAAGGRAASAAPSASSGIAPPTPAASTSAPAPPTGPQAPHDGVDPFFEDRR